MAQDLGGLAGATTPRLGMAIGRRNDYLHVLRVDDLLAHRTWDLTKVELVDSAGRVLSRTTGLAGDAGERTALDAQEVYRQRLIAVCRTLADRIEREPGLASFSGGVDVLRDVHGTLPEIMALFVEPRVLGAGAAGEPGTDTDPGDNGGFWHNLWHKAFG